MHCRNDAAGMACSWDWFVSQSLLAKLATSDELPEIQDCALKNVCMHMYVCNRGSAGGRISVHTIVVNKIALHGADESWHICNSAVLPVIWTLAAV